MIEIVSLLVGLLSGPQPIELTAGPDVAHVSVRLDGEAVAELDEPPWSTVVDLGPHLAVHHLEIVAQGADGEPLDRAERWINRPRPDPAAPPEGGDLIAVIDFDATDSLVRLLEDRRKQLREQQSQLDTMGLESTGKPRPLLPLDPRTRLYVLSPATATGTETAPRDLFADSPFYELDRPGIASHGLSYYLARLWPKSPPLRTADAVCVAGLRVGGSRGTRVVLVIADPESADASLYTPAEARDYLRELGVELVVWTPAADPGRLTAWGEVTSVDSWPALEGAVASLRSLLARPAAAEGEP